MLRRISAGPTVTYEDDLMWVDIPAMRVPVTPGEIVEILRYGGHNVEIVKNGMDEEIGWRVLP